MKLLSKEKNMLSTKDYGIFHTINGNRSADHNHVKKLAQAIEKKNLLGEFPILVNERMEIIDGQHRLLAASKVQVPIYYTIVRGLGLNDVTNINTASKSWSIGDFVESFIRLDNVEYIELKDFVQEFGVGYGMAGGLLGGQTTMGGRHTVQRIREGNFKVKSRDKAREIAEMLRELQPYAEFKVGADRALAAALFYTTMNKDFNADRLINKLKMHGRMIMKRSSARYYLIELDELYNFNAKQVVRLYSGQA